MIIQETENNWIQKCCHEQIELYNQLGFTTDESWLDEMLGLYSAKGAKVQKSHLRFNTFGIGLQPMTILTNGIELIESLALVTLYGNSNHWTLHIAYLENELHYHVTVHDNGE